jgi:hypothetical protein
MATNEPVRKDARHCPTCGTRGIMPLDQRRDRRGRIKNPRMLCPSCEEEFKAEGFTFMLFGGRP